MKNEVKIRALVLTTLLVLSAPAVSAHEPEPPPEPPEEALRDLHRQQFLLDHLCDLGVRVALDLDPCACDHLTNLLACPDRHT